MDTSLVEDAPNVAEQFYPQPPGLLIAARECQRGRARLLGPGTPRQLAIASSGSQLS